MHDVTSSDHVSKEPEAASIETSARAITTIPERVQTLLPVVRSHLDEKSNKVK